MVVYSRLFFGRLFPSLEIGCSVFNTMNCCPQTSARKSGLTEAFRLKGGLPFKSSSSGLEGSALSERPGSSPNGSSAAWQQTQPSLPPESSRAKSALHSGIGLKPVQQKKQPDCISIPRPSRGPVCPLAFSHHHNKSNRLRFAVPGALLLSVFKKKDCRISILRQSLFIKFHRNFRCDYKANESDSGFL